MVFDYLSVLFSVVVGLSLTLFLQQVARIIHERDKAVISWVQLTWATTILLWTVDFWYFTFALNVVEEWTLGLFLFVLIYATFLYALMALLFPEGGAPGRNYRVQFNRNRKWFFGTLFAFCIYDFGDYWIKYDKDLAIVEVWPFLLFIVTMTIISVAAWITERLVLQRIFAAIGLFVLVLMSVLTLDPLGS